jgi:hypothetical protein
VVHEQTAASDDDGRVCAAFDRLRDVPEIAGRIQKFGNRYYGIKLVDRKVAKLPVQRRGPN